jgi:MoaA/NifB/PqqE/SkfB family radical SAM enzyme
VEDSMQNSKVQLKEIIWEITGRCENHCDYCGSKEGWSKTINIDKIKKIGDEISNYLIDGEVNVSGGDPLLVPFNTHKYIVNSLQSRNNKVKIIVNPKSFLKVKDYQDILNLYDVIGVSVNNDEELKLFEAKLFPLLSKHTVITNFNMLNIWDYDVIEDFVKKHNLTWQIQYTMSNNKKETVYNNKTSKRFLFENIQKSLNDSVKIVLADNLNSGECSAGTRSLGILSDGDIVPCLSMRSWCDVESTFQGNILSESLKDIWEKQFKQYRFCEFECCKDICNAPFELIEEKKESYKTIEVRKWPEVTALYAVSTHPSVIAYGAYNPTMLYGVSSWTTTNNNDCSFKEGK